MQRVVARLPAASARVGLLRSASRLAPLSSLPRVSLQHTSPSLTICRRGLCVCATPPRLSSLDPQSPPAAAEPTAASAVADSGSDDSISILDSKGAKMQVTPLETFAALNTQAEWLAEGLQRLAYPSTTTIQKYTMPLLRDGHDVIGLAPTGSGKTVAFAVPALDRLQPNDDGSPAILVLAPTRELVQQTTKVFLQLSCGRVRVGEAYGGTPREIQARRLHSGCDVLVACPGRLKDFLDSGDVSIARVSFVIFDEADRLLDMGFQVQLDEILRHIDPAARVQKMMWSATWPREVQALANSYLAPDRVTVRSGAAGSGGLQINKHITQKLFYADGLRERVGKLAELIESGAIDDNSAKLIMFVERQTDTESAARALADRLGIDANYVGVIHGGLSQRQRDRVMRAFKHSDIRLLVATDVASRGLDIPDVTCVVNLQAPKNIDSYCHRIGRTGRAGRSGDAYTFLGSDDASLAADLAGYLAKCGAEVPPFLHDLAAKSRNYSGNNRRRLNNNNNNRGGRFSPRGGGGGGGYNNRGRSDSYGYRNNRNNNNNNNSNNNSNYGSGNDGNFSFRLPEEMHSDDRPSGW